MRWIILLFLLILLPASGHADWDFSRSSIDTDKIMSGGPPKDGIPALMQPKFIPGKQSNFMRPNEKVLGVVVDGVVKAYPTRILSWHELANDRFGDSAVLVSW